MPAKRDAIKGFVSWMLTDGQNDTEALSYAKLPKEVVAKEKQGPELKSNNVASTTTTVHGAGPLAGSRSFISKLREGDEIVRLITFLVCGIRCSRHGVARLRTLDRVRAAAPQVRLQFLRHRCLGSRLRAVRRAAVYLRHPGHRWRRSVHRRSPGYRRRHFPGRAGSRSGFRHPEFFIDLLAAVPSVIYGLLGVFIVVPMMRADIQPALKKTLGFLTAVSRAPPTVWVSLPPASCWPSW